jgi:hypothetical protein
VHLDNLAEKRRPQVESARLPEEKRQVGGKAQNFSWSALAVALTCRNRALEKKFAFGNTGDDVFRPHCPDVVADDVGDHALSEPFPRVGQKFPKRTQGALAFHWCSTFEFLRAASERPAEPYHV